MSLEEMMFLAEQISFYVMDMTGCEPIVEEDDDECFDVIVPMYYEDNEYLEEDEPWFEDFDSINCEVVFFDNEDGDLIMKVAPMDFIPR